MMANKYLLDNLFGRQICVYNTRDAKIKSIGEIVNFGDNGLIICVQTQGPEKQRPSGFRFVVG